MSLTPLLLSSSLLYALGLHPTRLAMVFQTLGWLGQGAILYYLIDTTLGHNLNTYHMLQYLLWSSTLFTIMLATHLRYILLPLNIVLLLCTTIYHPAPVLFTQFSKTDPRPYFYFAHGIECFNFSLLSSCLYYSTKLSIEKIPHASITQHATVFREKRACFNFTLTRQFSIIKLKYYFNLVYANFI